MKGRFRKAFLWHMEHHDTKLADLVNATGVSRDILNKLLARPESSTHVEAAIEIAGFYGKNVEEFMRCEPSGREREFVRLLGLLPEEPRKLILAQLRALVAQAAADREGASPDLSGSGGETD